MQPSSVQPAVIQGSVGTPYNVLFQAQAGQMPVTGQAILAPRLALVPGGARPGAPLAAAATAAAAAQGAQYRSAGVSLPGMGVLLKAPARKSSGPQQKGRKHCNCKNSRCLKLYCECFASGRYCDNCNCISCYNNRENEAVRQSAVEAILERNPNAFRPKIQTAEGDTHPTSIRNAPDGSVRHTKGCNCKKSSCLKKYCECFQGGIFCTEICKCVDCKNYDGSEARAQVLSIQEPFNVQQLHQAAAQHALKRQRVMQAMPQLAGTAGLLQAQNALQHLAAAAAAGGPNAPTMSLQQLQALQAAAVASTPAAPQQPAAAPQQLPRPPLLDVVHDLVKPAMIEELCQLLILVAKEEADKQHSLKQQQQGQSQQPQTNSTEQEEEAAAVEPAGPHANGVKQEGAAAEIAQQPPVKSSTDADGDDTMQEAGDALQQPQPEAVDASYAAQEAVVLQEFNAILQRIIDTADKKAKATASTAGAVDAAAPAGAPAATGVAASQDGSTANGAADSEQQQQQQHQGVLQQPKAMAQPLQVRPAMMSLPQQALAQQQAMMLQAASNNYALAQLQQRALLAGGAAFPAAGGLGMQLQPMGMGMQQMVQVMAQDGSVHRIPASALMSLVGAQQQQQQQAAPAATVAMTAAGPAQAPAVPAATAAAMAAPISAAPATANVSLLQLLNGAINGSSNAAAGTGGGA